jgi:substrate import-associated zinc metallohydrolase lipoprotein
MKTQKIFLIFSALAVFVASCNKDEKLNIITPVGLGGDSFERTALDQWLYDSLTVPYNIAVKYRWDPWELNLDKTLTPPDESKIIPAMSAIKRVWIDPYNDETGSDVFIKKYSPKQFKLVGSVEYNFNGTVLLGQAEGGNNIAFFDINQNFDKNAVSSIMRMIHTSHHEFAHILNQNVIYPPDFKGVSGRAGFTGYTATWFNVTDEEALNNGYITPYSMASSDEDFVEMTSNMLTLGKARYDELVNSVDEEVQAVFRTKEQYVVNYFKEVWNIDFYSLQTRVNNALNALVPPPAIHDSYGVDKEFTTASIDFNNLVLLPQRASFTLMMQDAATEVQAIPLPSRLTLDSIAVLLTEPGNMLLRMYISQNGQTFFADFKHTYTLAAGVYDYTYLEANDNGELIKGAVQPVLDYFANNQFTVSWYKDPSISIFPRAKFTTVASSSDYFIALLLP